MKIFSISRIKNEEDIIESFVRYHLNFIDEMVIIEDYSNDETYNILKKLKDDEKLPIHIYRNSKKPIPQKEVINNAFNIALNDFNADLIVPLDTDEFLVCKDGGNPREILEKLPQDKYYQVFWRTYLPSLDEKSFSLDRLESIRDPMMDDRSKIIIPSGLTEKYEVTITPGSHSIENKDIPSEELDELRIAHIPIRNKIQCISKETIGWLNDISDYYKDPKASWHQNIMFRMLVESEGDISDEDIINYAKEYSSRKSFDVDIAEKKHPFDTSFCKNMELKYTPDYSENSYAKILEFSEDLALNYGKANQTLKDVNEDILDGNLDEMNYLCALEDAYAHVKKQLYLKENQLILRSKNYIGKIELKNEKIAELKEKVSENKALHNKISKKNDRIVELKDIVSQKNDRIVELKDIVSQKNDRIVELKDIVSQKNDRIVELKGKISEKNNAIIKLREENEKLKKLNNEMQNSTSWKVTKPFRRG